MKNARVRRPCSKTEGIFLQPKENQALMYIEKDETARSKLHSVLSLSQVLNFNKIQFLSHAEMVMVNCIYWLRLLAYRYPQVIHGCGEEEHQCFCDCLWDVNGCLTITGQIQCLAHEWLEEDSQTSFCGLQMNHSSQMGRVFSLRIEWLQIKQRIGCVDMWGSYLL